MHTSTPPAHRTHIHIHTKGVLRAPRGHHTHVYLFEVILPVAHELENVLACAAHEAGPKIAHHRVEIQAVAAKQEVISRRTATLAPHLKALLSGAARSTTARSEEEGSLASSRKACAAPLHKLHTQTRQRALATFPMLGNRAGGMVTLCSTTVATPLSSLCCARLRTEWGAQ